MNSNHPIDRLVAYSLSGGLPIVLFCISVLLGLFALNFTPREEEPQIVVPIVDISVFSPGLSAQQVERQVTTPIEKLLAQIPGVENVYSSSRPGQTNVTLRFYVGENRENAILNTYNKLLSNRDKVPKVVDDWFVKPIEVDDVPILLLGLWSDDPALASDFELRRIADEVATSLQAIQNTSQVNVVGGRPRTVRILLKPESLSARQSSSVDIVHALQVTNLLQRVGNWSLNNESIILESGDFILDISELKQTVVNVVNGIPVLLQDVADVLDGPDEATNYTWIEFSTRHPSFKKNLNFPMVTISVAKQRGSNAVSVARDVHSVLGSLSESLFSKNIHVEVIRDYGETANEKVNNLTSSLIFAVLTVIVFVAIFLGWRPALVIGIAVPISYGITLALDMAFGYTINRVTLFALILSLGLLVDDPITGVDNIERFYREKTGTASDKIIAAISELKVPLIMSTITIILAFIPLAFITGMMGPYMAPMAFNVPVSVMVSTVVAFVVTPWLAKKILKNEKPRESKNSILLSNYRRVLAYFLGEPKKSKYLLLVVLALFLITAMLPVLRLVPIKLLPYDNKNVLQVVIDLPESATLEMTASLAKKASSIILQLNEVQSVASYIGEPSPIDFNGMVRQYYHRKNQNLADLRILLVDRELREHHSHGIALRLQSLLKPLIENDVVIKIVETPAGPPVLSTLVAEVYGSKLTSYESLRSSARLLKKRFEQEAFVGEVDVSIESDHKRLRFIVDKQKAAMSGISTEDVNQTLLIANSGYQIGFIQFEREARPLPLTIRLPLSERASMSSLHSLQIKGREGIVQNSSIQGLEDAPLPLVALGELGEFVALEGEKTIYHKDLKPVVYVTAEVSGRTPAEVIADIHSDFGQSYDNKKTSWDKRTFINPGGGEAWSLASDIRVVWNGEGEWKITIDVFRDMGLAFIFALIGIFVVLNYQTSSTTLSLIIMSAIPLTIIGIMPGFLLLNLIGEKEIVGIPDPTLFTATAMIGMIALAGIVVRNSLILVEFIEQQRSEGLPIKEALLQAGSIRMRPILLTAGTTLLGNLVITLDPVFSGLAIAIIFGIIASTFFTLFVVPIVYFLVFDEEQVDQNSTDESSLRGTA